MTAVSRSDDPLIGEDIAGYRVEARLGEGGMGQVYRAVLPTIGAQVAIKVLSRDLIGDAEMAERFVTEARLANLVRHDGLVNVIGLGVLPDGRPYQIMELLTGEPLAAILSRRGRLPLGSLCELVSDALVALAPMHARGIVHRDLKPSNLFVTATGRVKIIDFGIAKLITHRGITRTGQTLGTPDYMAPEQIEGDDVDGRTDIYALGVVLFEGTTGARPFAGRVLEALATHPTPPSVLDRVPDAPAALDAVIRTAMDPDRSRRYTDAAAMERAVRAVIADLPPAAFGPLHDAEALPVAPASDPASPTASTIVEADRPVVRRLGKYEVRATIGEGGAGVVMIGFDPAVGRQVALKVLHDSTGRRRDRLLAEARAMAKVGHPNVATLYELGDDDGRLFLVMELVEGTDVAAWLRAEPRAWRAIVEVFVAAGRGLAAAHAAGVIHRDFKPSNILLGVDGRPRVTDFGLAHTGDDDAAAGGTAAYVAPEQLEGGVAGPEADQFAFCAALWEALHGELPFAGANAVAIATAARAGLLRPPANPAVPPALNAALRRGLAGDRALRFPAMTDLLAAIERALAPPRRTWRPWVAAGAIVLAATAIAIVVAIRPTAPSRPATTLADVAAAGTPTDVFTALAGLSPATLAGPEARTLAARAAAEGPIRTISAAGTITAIGFSPAGDRVAIGSAAAIELVRIDAPGVVRLPPVHQPPLELRFTDDGTALLALVRDGVIEVPLDGSPSHYRVLCPDAPAQPGPIPLDAAINTTRDFRYVACPGATGGSVFEASGAVGRPVLAIDGNFAFAFDGKRIVVNNPLRGPAVYDLATGAQIAAATDFVSRYGMTSTQAMVDNGELIAITTGSKIVIWDPRTGTDHAFETELAPEQLLLTPGPEAVVIGTTPEGEVTIWHTDGRQVAHWLLGQRLRATTVPVAAPKQRVLMQTDDGVVIRDLRQGRVTRVNHTADLIKPSPDGSGLAMARGATLALWFDLAPPRSIPVDFDPASYGRLSYYGIAESFDSRWIAYHELALPHAVHLLDTVTGDDVRAPDTFDVQRVGLAGDGSAVGGLTADHRAKIWSRGSGTVRDLGAIDPAWASTVMVLDAERLLVLDDQTHGRMIGPTGVTTPCGDQPVELHAGPLLIVRGATGGLATCEVDTGRSVTLAAIDKVADLTISPDGSRMLAVHDGGELTLVRTSDGASSPLPALSDQVVAASLDDGGTRAAVVTLHQRMFVLDAGTGAIIPITTTGSPTQPRISSDGTRVAAVVGPHIVEWDVAHPEAPRVAGELATQFVLLIDLPPRPGVTTINASHVERPGGALEIGLTLNLWRDGPAELADVKRWIQLVAPR